MADHPINRSFDIRVYKKNLRTEYRERRNALAAAEKRRMDAAIFENIRKMEAFQNAQLVLCYVSIGQEVDSHEFIKKCIAAGKTVAVPRCIDGTREMDFYAITSMAQLVRRTFGVMEPEPETTEKIVRFEHAVCIIPALCYDVYGYRLGYGGGYYDRFLSQKFRRFKHNTTIGVCYKSFLRPKLHHGRYDVPCGYIATEESVLPTKNCAMKR